MKKVATRRTFDLDLKLDLVKQIESGRIRVSEVSRIYQVSQKSIYKWLHKYSDLYKNQTRVVVEKKSISNKNKELQQRIAELERALGQKQMRIDYLEQVVDVASSELGVDIEKKSKRRS